MTLCEERVSGISDIPKIQAEKSHNSANSKKLIAPPKCTPRCWLEEAVCLSAQVRNSWAAFCGFSLLVLLFTPVFFWARRWRGGGQQVFRDLEEVWRCGGKKANNLRERRGARKACWEAQGLLGSPCWPTFAQLTTSRKSAQEKEHTSVPVSFSLNIEGPQRSKTILDRELQGGEEKVLCTSEEMKGKTNNIVLMILLQSLWALSSDQPHPSDPETFIVTFCKEKKICFGQNSLSYSISQETI